jgi:hypothetical protein
MWPESVRSSDEWHQPLRQFAFHYVFVQQPQDSFGHVGVGREQDDHGKPLLDVASHGFRVQSASQSEIPLDSERSPSREARR